MYLRTSKFAAVVATTALVAVVGAGAAAQAKSAAGTSSTSTSAHRGPGAADVSALAAKLGVTVTRLRAAFDAARPARPAAGAKPGSGPGKDDLAATVATALNVETSKVQAILDANRPTTRPAAGTNPDRTALVSALAAGLNVGAADVTAALAKADAAHKAQHDAHDKVMAAAIARELGLDTATVQAALATRPAK
jgi:hypothetical protein